VVLGQHDSRRVDRQSFLDRTPGSPPEYNLSAVGGESPGSNDYGDASTCNLENGMQAEDAENFYRGYIACLNSQDWSHLAAFVGADVHHNGHPLGVRGYQAMLESDFKEIPDLRFVVELTVANADCVASRLRFECSPQGEFMGLPVNGKRVVFWENVFYQLHNDRISRVWSVIDKEAIKAQL
jgi:predicted ester cyclase